MFTLNGGVEFWFIIVSGFGSIQDHLGSLLELVSYYWNLFILNQVWDLVSTDHEDVLFY